MFAKAQKRTIIIALLLTPAFSAGEVTYLIYGLISSHSTLVTPVYVKAVKDVLMVGLIFLGVIQIKASSRIFLPDLYSTFLLCSFISLVLTVCYQGVEVLYLAAGIRALIPFVLVIFVYKCVDYKLQQSIARVLRILLCVALSLQIVQLLFAPPYFGANYFGLNSRNPGIFIVPSTMACFAVVSMYYIRAFLPPIWPNQVAFWCIGPFAVLLTASGSGIVSASMLMAVAAINMIKEKFIALVVVPLLAGGAFLLLPEITGRDDIYSSLAIRFVVLFGSLSENTVLLSNQFGMWTNAADTFAQARGSEDGMAMISDSTITSAIGNFGGLALLFLLASLVRAYSRQGAFFLFAAAFLPLSLTLNINEAFPANLLLAVSLAYFYHSQFATRVIRDTLDPGSRMMTCSP